ncbi:hypothetical protein D5073_00355 [Pectobacterium versatile]|nr:hypothetical protein EIP93_03780 [Pectobacterium versatile]PRI20728.1 hypothetical protein BZY99_00670 [Pectobacterium versatile]RJL55002.1 hypothetical protein D5076_17475 [Pectobacterium versatile]RJL60050.1 hypothetical protein D5073_00355 [Pectobacterium versatile]RJL62821.1 hypothetical protein D5080_11005 [Pectobacterium versatile]
MKWNLIVIKKKRGFIYNDHVAGIFLSGKKAERDGAHITAPNGTRRVASAVDKEVSRAAVP